MTQLSRRRFLAGTTAATALLAGGAPYVQAQKRGGTLRVMPHADLKSVDPVWTTAYISRNHGRPRPSPVGRRNGRPRRPPARARR